MTLLFYWPEKDVVGHDNQITHDNGTGSSMNGKSFTTANGVGCSCGSVFGSESAIVSALDLAAEGRVFGPCGKNLDQAGFIRDKAGKVWTFGCHEGEIVLSKPPDHTPSALGSGSEWFHAFCSKGLTPLEAAQEVALLHDECGGDINTF